MSDTLVKFRFYTIKDVSIMLGISESSAQRIIKKLNKELEQEGYIVIAGKIGRDYFESKIMM